MNSIDEPVRVAFRSFLEQAGLFHSTETILGLTFRRGGLHFAAKALEFLPPDQTVIVVGTGLSTEEIDYLTAAGYPTFSYDHPFDNELVYEMIMNETGGAFGWVDADCFVVNPRLWDDLLASMAPDVSTHAAFTYDPLVFARPTLVVWRREARDVLTAAGTTLNSYAPEPTNVGRAALYSISRLVQDRHLHYLEEVLGRGPDGDLVPHDGLLDVYENVHTLNSRMRDRAPGWYGQDARRTSWLLDTPLMAEVVLRAHGFRTHRVVSDNVQVSDDVIHVGASSYRERMRDDGASQPYLARHRLTDLFEVLLAEELVRRGFGAEYAELAALQTERLEREAGIPPAEIRATARSMLHEDGVDVTAVLGDDRFAFLRS